MLHIYRQITALRAFRPVVFCQKRVHAADFPFGEIVVLPKPRTHPLRRFVQKQLLDRPITIYRSEARRILGPGKLLENGQRSPLAVAVGDEVIYGKYSGSDIEVDGHEVKILRESDILAKVVN